MAGAASRKLAPVEDTAGQKPEAPSGAPEVAAAEVLTDGQKSITWRGHKLTIPPEIPPVLMFDFISMESDENAMSLMRMFMTLLGDTQFIVVRNEIGKVESDKQIDLIGELSERIMDSYGTTEGESEASASSSESTGD